MPDDARDEPALQLWCTCESETQNIELAQKNLVILGFACQLPWNNEIETSIKKYSVVRKSVPLVYREDQIEQHYSISIRGPSVGPSVCLQILKEVDSPKYSLTSSYVYRGHLYERACPFPWLITKTSMNLLPSDIFIFWYTQSIP